MSSAVPQLPSVSIVVASAAGGAFLFKLLDSLADQVREEDAELIVPDRVGGATVDRLRRDYPWLRVVDVPTPPGGRKPSVPELRAIGVEEAHGEIAVVIEEHCRAPQGWLRAIRESFRPGDAAIGGPILDDDWDRLRDWVVYFSEYHNYLPPWTESPRSRLNGANTAYRRSVLMTHRERMRRGYWEVEVHPWVEREGAMRGVPQLGVHHTGPFDFGYYLRQRYLLARVWGAMQRDKVSAARRLFYLVFAPVFPLLLFARIAARVRQSGRHFGRFVAASPLLVPVTLAYVAGEWSGYAFGFGNALEEVE